MKTQDIEKRLDSIEIEVDGLRKAIKASTVDKQKEMSDFLFSILNHTIRDIAGDKLVNHLRLSDHEWLFQQDYKNGALWIRYSLVWSVFESKFHLNYDEIKTFIASWIDSNTEWKGLTPRNRTMQFAIQIDSNTEWKGLTPKKNN